MPGCIAGESRDGEVRASCRLPLITHKPNIVDALGKDWFDVKEGEASIFMPEGGKYRLVGRVPMEDWPKLALTAN